MWGFVPFAEIGIMWRMLSFTGWTDERLSYVLLHMDSFRDLISEEDFNEVCNKYQSFKPALGKDLGRVTDIGCRGNGVWEQGYNVASRSPSSPHVDGPHRLRTTDKRWAVHGTDQSSIGGIWDVKQNVQRGPKAFDEFLWSQRRHFHRTITWVSVYELRGRPQEHVLSRLRRFLEKGR